MNDPRFEQEVWNTEILADYLGVCRQKIYEMVRSNQIPHRKLPGKLIVFSRDRIKAWLNDDQMGGFKYLLEKIGVPCEGKSIEEIYEIIDFVAEAAVEKQSKIKNHKQIFAVK